MTEQGDFKFESKDGNSHSFLAPGIERDGQEYAFMTEEEYDEEISRLEKYDHRARLFKAGISREWSGFHLNIARQLEKESCCQAFGLILYPDGHITSSGTNLYLSESNRLEFENLDNFRDKNPASFENNIRFHAAIARIMRGQPPEISNPVEIPLARVAIGTVYRLTGEDGKKKIVCRVNKSDTNAYCGIPTSSHYLIKTLQSVATHPGDYVLRSYNEIIPAVERKGVIIPINPSRNLETHDEKRIIRGVAASDRSESYYYSKALTIKGIPKEALTSPSGNPYAVYHDVLAQGKYKQSHNMFELAAADMATARYNTGLSFSLPPFVGKEKIQTMRNCIANLNPVTSSLEISKVIDIGEVEGGGKISFFDPEFGSVIMQIDEDELVKFALEAMNDPKYNFNQDMGIITENLPPIPGVEYFSGVTGQRLEQSEIERLKNSHQIKNGLAANIWGIAKFLANQAVT